MIHDRLSPNQAPRQPGQDVRLIILHATVGSAASALGWLTNPDSRVSTHYLIEKAGPTWRLVGEDAIAFHAGVGRWGDITDLNAHSIGVELENRNDGRDPWPARQLDALRWLIAGIADRHRLTPDAIVLHSMVATPGGRKTDPAGFDLAACRAQFGGAPPCYRVAGPAPIRVHQGPGRSFPVAGVMVAGAPCALGAITVGEALPNPRGGRRDARWAWRADGLGFVPMGDLEAV